MKPRNVALFLSAMLLSTSVYAIGNGISGGSPYVGLTGGWGKIDYDTDTGAYFTGGGSPAAVKSGGFAGRVYLGYLVPNSAGSDWLFGPELGYSFYQHNIYTEDAGPYNSTTTESADGVDLLLNVTYGLTQHLNLAVKPGIQYASQKDSTIDRTTHSNSDLPSSVSNSKIAPEIVIEINWQLSPTTPLFVGASYQYVFADSAIGTFQRLSTAGDSYASITSRQMLGLNIEYAFN